MRALTTSHFDPACLKRLFLVPRASSITRLAVDSHQAGLPGMFVLSMTAKYSKGSHLDTDDVVNGKVGFHLLLEISGYIEILITLPDRESGGARQEFVAEDLGQEDIVGQYIRK